MVISNLPVPWVQELRPTRSFPKLTKEKGYFADLRFFNMVKTWRPNGFFTSDLSYVDPDSSLANENDISLDGKLFSTVSLFTKVYQWVRPHKITKHYFKKCKLTTEELTIRSNRHWQPTQPSRIPVFRGQYIHHSLLFWSLYSSYPLTLFRKKPLWWDSKNNLSRVFPILLHTIETRASFSPVSSAWLVVSLFLYLFFFKRREQYVYTEIHADMTSYAHPFFFREGERL